MSTSTLSPTPTDPRLAPRRPAGLLGLALLAGLGVLGLADSVGEHDGLSAIDPHVAADAVAQRSGSLTALAQTLTFVGSEAAAAVIALVALLVLVVRRDLGRAGVVATAMLGSATLTLVVKLLVARPRPGAVDRLGPVDSTYSFPSGHVLNSAVVLAMLLWLLWPAASRGVRTLAAVGVAVLVVGIAASRVYLGYHWFTDTLGSTLVATAWLSVLLLLAPWIRRTTETVADRIPWLARFRRPQR